MKERTNRLGGLGSGLTYIGNNTFLALPDRGPNAVAFNACDDDTVSYISRFHTLRMNLSPSDAGSKFPMTLTPMVTDTTLLYSRSPLVYGFQLPDAHEVTQLADSLLRLVVFPLKAIGSSHSQRAIAAQRRLHGNRRQSGASYATSGTPPRMDE